jgi:hypothetical protein
LIKEETKIKQIISGEQSGVDRSALDFSIQFNIPHAGWCPKGRWAEDGRISDKYNLTETETIEELLEYRTLKNVQNSDGTLIIYNITLNP